MRASFTETYDFLVSIIGNAPYGIIAIDMEGYVTMCNGMALNDLHIESKVRSIVEKELLQYILHIPRLKKKVETCLKRSRKIFNLNNIEINDKIINIKGRIILNGMIITTADITEAKDIERKMMNAVLEGQESERRRLAKEIHDGIGPMMSTIKLNMESVKKDLDSTAEKALSKIESMEDLVHSVAKDIRGISHALMPSALKDFGLIDALENLIMKINQAEKIQVSFFQKGLSEHRLEENIELGLYRIIQELINNTLKYAQAKHLEIQLILHKDMLSLTVEDDGVGFEKEKIQEHISTGIGLQNIKTRVTTLKGNLEIDTSPGKGVSASIEIPIS